MRLVKFDQVSGLQGIQLLIDLLGGQVRVSVWLLVCKLTHHFCCADAAAATNSTKHIVMKHVAKGKSLRSARLRGT